MMVVNWNFQCIYSGRETSLSLLLGRDASRPYGVLMKGK